MNARQLLVAIGAVSVAALMTGCEATTSGFGTAARDAAARSSADFPVQSKATPSETSTSQSASTSASSPAEAPSPRSVTVQGTTTGDTIVAQVYATDDLKNCANHAYGAPMIAFLRKHPCQHAHRALATIDLNGRTVVVSTIEVAFGPINGDPYAGVAQFAKLERAGGTGSMNDLLQEGHPIPGVATKIPYDEVFQVISQDAGATVFDAWYAEGKTADNDPALSKLESDLVLTPLTTG